jgi:hypothetical protein
MLLRGRYRFITPAVILQQLSTAPEELSQIGIDGIDNCTHAIDPSTSASKSNVL